MTASDRVQFSQVGDGYEATAAATYYSPRYNRSITVPAGFYSDGATWAPDIDSDAWWFHDVLCRYGKWDDGTACSRWQASTVLYDIMRRDGFPWLAPWWWAATYLFGGGATRDGKTYLARWTR